MVKKALPVFAEYNAVLMAQANVGKKGSEYSQAHQEICMNAQKIAKDIYLEMEKLKVSFDIESSSIRYLIDEKTEARRRHGDPEQA